MEKAKQALVTLCSYSKNSSMLCETEMGKFIAEQFPLNNSVKKTLC